MLPWSASPAREPRSACAWGHRLPAGEHEPCCANLCARCRSSTRALLLRASCEARGAAWETPGPSSSCPLLYNHNDCLPNESVQINQCFCPLDSSITPSRTDLKHPKCVWSCYVAARIEGAQETVNHATLMLSLTMRIRVSLHLPVTGGLRIVLNKHPGSCTCNRDWVRKTPSRLGPWCLCLAAESPVRGGLAAPPPTGLGRV